MDFSIPEDPRALWEEPEGPGLRVTRLDEFAGAELNDAIRRRASELYDRSPLDILEQDAFNALASVLASIGKFPEAKCGLLGDALASSLTCLCGLVDEAVCSPGQGQAESRQQLERCRAALCAHLFFMDWLLKTAAAHGQASGACATSVSLSGDKKPRRKRGGPDADAAVADAPTSGLWEHLLSKSVKAAYGAVNCDLWVLFRPSSPDRRLLDLLELMAMAVLRDPTSAKDAAAVRACGRMLGVLAVRYRRVESAAASLVDFISSCEHSPIPAAEALFEATTECNDSQLAALVIAGLAAVDPGEYARQQAAVGERAGVRSVGPFLEEVALRLPRVVGRQWGVVLPHLGANAHTLRSSIVTATAILLECAFEREPGQEETANAAASRLRSKSHLLQVLVDRVRDVSSYTRKACLSAWARLTEAKAVPLSHWAIATDLAIGRLEDKSSLVRKEALRLLQSMMLNNPFGPSLPTAAFAASLETHRQMLESLEATRIAGDFERLKIDGAGGADVKADPEEEEEPCDAPPAIEGWSGSLEELQALVASLDLATRFARCIADCLPLVGRLLASVTVSDVQESMGLLLRCKQFSVDGVDMTIRKALPLIFSKDPAIKAHLVEAYHVLYVQGWSGNRFGPATAASNLIDLSAGATLGELASLGVLIKELTNKGHVSEAIMLEIWSRVERAAGPAASPSSQGHRLALVHLRGALFVLSHLVSVHPGLITVSRLGALSHLLEGPHAPPDTMVTKRVCATLCALGPRLLADTAPFGPGAVDAVGVALAGALLDPLRRALRDSGDAEEAAISGAFYPGAQAAIDAVFETQSHPTALCAAVLNRYAAELEACLSAADDAAPGRRLASPAAVLGPFFFLVGQAALAQLVAVETRARAARRRLLAKPSSSGGTTAAGEAEADDIDAELGTSAASADAALDALHERAEAEILGGDYLGPHARLVATVCRSKLFLSTTACPADVRASALLCLAKLAVVDARFCEATLPLIFTLLKGNVLGPGLRSTLVVAAADVALRFPNALEPWSAHVYAPLADPEASVRRDALTVLSHLVLSDMMKVKGYVAGMARCLADDDAQCAALAELFFHELARKEVKGSNPVYNLLPDILSALSNDSLLGKAAFQKIMRKLLGLVRKDKHADALVDKLCQRFARAATNVQWHNIAFCLTQLPISEKGLQKLVESFKLYREALADPDVAAAFQSIIKKVSKTDKTLADELEERVADATTGRTDQGEESAAAAEIKRERDAENGRTNSPSVSALANQIGALEMDDVRQLVAVKPERDPDSSQTPDCPDSKHRRPRTRQDLDQASVDDDCGDLIGAVHIP